MAWAKFSPIVMTKNTVKMGGNTATETSCFISKLPLNVGEVARAIYSPWMVESYK